MKIIAQLFLAVSFLSIFALSAKAEPIENYEVSILFPLPDISHWDDLLSAKSADNILPFPLFEKIPYLLNQPNDKTYPDLRVVGVRIDPCFTEGRAPLRCQKLMRMIWQPLANQSGETTTVDSSLHTFFEFTDGEFSELIGQIKNLRAQYSADYAPFTHTPLSVNPLLKKFGLQSDYARKIKNLILTATAEKPIKRITFMKLKGMNDFWVFGGLNLVDNNYEVIKIPRLEADVVEQEFINQFAIRPNPTSFRGGIFPAPNDTDLFNLIAKDAAEADGNREEDLKTMIRSIADFEHPSRNNPGTLDCVTCHLANTMRSWATAKFPALNLQAEYDNLSYKNEAVNLTNLNPLQAQTNNLRMFGYIGREPVSGQRTINESAEVVRTINTSSY